MTRPRTTAAAMLLLAVAALAQSTPPDALHRRAANFRRAGWFVVDGRFAQPQVEFTPDSLVALVETQDHFAIVARPNDRAEPLLRNYRTALVRLAGSDFAWKMSCPGRTWDDTRATATQHLQLLAVAETITAAAATRLTKIDVTPVQQTVQAVVLEDDEPISVIVVFGPDFVEAAVGRFGQVPTTLIRSGTARKLMAERPVETRRYVLPVLRLLSNGDNPLAAAAGDVYRAFPDLPTDPAAVAAVARIIPQFTSAEPAARRAASDALLALGRRGVQAAMRVDLQRLPPEAAERVAAFVAAATRDSRPADVLRKDPNFQLDCLNDVDPNVRVAAGAWVGK